MSKRKGSTICERLPESREFRTAGPPVQRSKRKWHEEAEIPDNFKRAHRRGEKRGASDWHPETTKRRKIETLMAEVNRLQTFEREATFYLKNALEENEMLKTRIRRLEYHLSLALPTIHE